MSIDIRRYNHIVVLTGAGISAGSGLPTYRGAGGLWEKDAIASLANAEAWRDRPNEVWELFGGLRAQIRAVEPNLGHRSLAQLEKLAPGDFVVITQNVDGLHQRAGSAHVIELHGNLHHTRCSNQECTLETYLDETAHAEAPLCSLCSSKLRPDIVLFGESLPVLADHLATRALRDCDLFIAIGTSGTVSPASRFVRSAAYAGAHTMLLNLEAIEGGGVFEEQVLGKAEELLPQIVASSTAA